VAKLALHPRMNDLIDPHIIRFKTKLRKDMSLVTFANSITLTPGTITILIRDGYYFVHAIDMKVAGDLPGEMEERVGHVFMEDSDG
jgi:multicomponent Na+:H+ antiporter subunit E